MRFEIYRWYSRWRWRVVAGNHQVIADSGNSYSSASHARETIQKIAIWIGENDAVDVITHYRDRP